MSFNIFKICFDMFRHVCLFKSFYVTWVGYILSHERFFVSFQVISKCWRRQHGTRRRTWQRNCGPSGPQLCLGESTVLQTNPQEYNNTVEIHQSWKQYKKQQYNKRRYCLFPRLIDVCLQMLIDDMRKLWWQPTVQPSFCVFVVRFTVFLTLNLAACQGSRAGNQYHIFLWHGVVLTRVVLDLGTSKEQVHKKLNSPESVLAPDTFHILSPFTFFVARCYELGMNYIKLHLLISGFCF